MSQQYKAQLPLAVTLGEPAGIGPELLLDVAGQVAAGNQSIPPFLVIGDAGHLKSVADKTDRPFRSKILPDFLSFDPQATDVLQIIETTARVTDTDFGQPNPANCQMVVEAIDRAVAATLDGQARAVVTSPIHKHTMYMAGFKFPGHTEYLAERCEKALGREFTPVMMMAGPELRTVPATIHIPLADVAAQLTAGLIEQTASIVLQALEQQFGIQAPRLAVAGLNPHAGEDGAMGREEIDIVMPALENLRQRGYPVQGPLAADSLFHAAARTTYDAVLTMYHDQALIPAKMLGFDETVNVTLGLPLVRTSPDHGTAFDIAGKGIARPAALLAAMRMAAQLTTSQRKISPQ